MSVEIKDKIFKRFENKLSYSKKNYKSNIDFEHFLKEHFLFVIKNENFLHKKFDELENISEESNFIKSDIATLLLDMQENILDKENVDIIDNENELKEILTRTSGFLENSLRCLKNNKKSILSMELTDQFFGSLGDSKKQIIDSFSQEENNYQKLEDVQNFEKLFHEIEIYLDKIYKASVKIKKTHIFVTIDEEIFERNVEKFKLNENIEKEEILIKGKKCTKSLRTFSKTLKSLLDSNFKKIEFRHVKKFCENFYNEFSQNFNKFEEIFALSYIYRDQLSNKILYDTSSFVSLILEKIIVLKTIIFLKFAENNLFPEIPQTCQEINEKINDGVTSFDITQITIYEQKLEKIFHLVNYMKSYLTFKRTNFEIFNNEILNNTIPYLIDALSQYFFEAKYLKRELLFFKEILYEFQNYNKIISQIKLSDLKNMEEKNNTDFQNLMQKFMLSHTNMKKLIASHTQESIMKNNILEMMQTNENTFFILFDKIFYPPE